MKLSVEDFKSLVKNGILLSIDLIIKNENGEVLVGKRKNNPAKGYWFVPGGRIFKNESFKDALHRVCKAEVGILKVNSIFKLLGFFNHIYNDNFFGDPTFNTHYMAIGVKLKISEIHMKTSIHDQHDEIKFMSISDILNDTNVHENTRYYFTDNAPNRFI